MRGAHPRQGVEGTQPLIGHVKNESTLIFTPDASLPAHLYYQSALYEWRNPADPTVNRIVLRQPAGDARLTFDGVASEVKAANDSSLEVLAPPADASNSVYDGLFAPGGVPRAAVVNLTLSSAEEDFVGGPPYMYHAEPSVSLVFPAAGPVDGGTRLTVSGAGFAPQGEAAAGPYPNQEGSDPNTVYSAARLRCLFDASAATPPAQPDALPSGSAPTVRNDTRVLCASPPSHDAQPPYLNHGASLGVLPRVVALRIALNGVTGSAASVPFSYYRDATVSAVERRNRPERRSDPECRLPRRAIRHDDDHRPGERQSEPQERHDPNDPRLDLVACHS